MGFTKLFSQILDSTIWDEPWEVKGVWITLLAMADSKGRVMASIPGLARRATVSIEQAEKAIGVFLSPDKYSRTPDFDGRRLEVIEGGWRIINYLKYREMRDGEARKEYQRDWVKDKRSRQKVSTIDQEKPQSTQAEAEADTEKEVPPKPPKGGTGRSRRSAKALLEAGEVSPDAVKFGKLMVQEWRKEDPDGRTITGSPIDVITRMQEISERQPLYTPEVQYLAGIEYLSQSRNRYKAPQYFLSMEPDPHTGKPPFKPYCDAIIHGQKAQGAA